jgi:hypothetical protein
MMSVTRQNLLYGFVGLFVGAAATYVVMDFLHEKELDDIYGELDGLREDAAADALEKYQGGSITSIHSHVPPTGLPDHKIESGGVGDGEYPSAIVGTRVCDEPGASRCTHDVPLNKPCLFCDEVTEQDAAAEHFIPNCAHGNPITVDCSACDAETLPDDVSIDEAHLVAHPWDSDSSIPTTPGGQPADEEDFITEDQIEAATLEAMAIADANPEMPTIIPDNKVTQPTIIGKFDRDTGAYEIVKSMSISHPDLDEVIENDALYALIGDEAFDQIMESLHHDAPEVLRTLAVRNTVLAVDFVIQY